jgi:hypothetical protein
MKRFDFGPINPTDYEQPKGKFVLYADFWPERHKAKQALTHLKNLIKAVEDYSKWMDEEMKKPSTHERGSRIAKVLNNLDYVKDCAKMFGLPRKVKK